jgi:hypothetical protein
MPDSTASSRESSANGQADNPVRLKTLLSILPSCHFAFSFPNTDTGVSAHRPFPCPKKSTFPIHEPVCLSAPLIFAGPSPYFPQNLSRENILAAQ